MVRGAGAPTGRGRGRGHSRGRGFGDDPVDDEEEMSGGWSFESRLATVNR